MFNEKIILIIRSHLTFSNYWSRYWPSWDVVFFVLFSIPVVFPFDIEILSADCRTQEHVPQQFVYCALHWCFCSIPKKIIFRWILFLLSVACRSSILCIAKIDAVNLTFSCEFSRWSIAGWSRYSSISTTSQFQLLPDVDDDTAEWWFDFSC